MRHAAVALLMLSGPASAVAGDAAAPACRLTPAECAVVLREVAAEMAAAGHLTSTGRPYAPTAVAGMLDRGT